MSYASPDSLLQPSNAEEGYGLHAPFIARLPSFIDDQAKAHLARRATTPFAQKRRAAINERAATILKSPDAVPKFLLDLVATGEWDILGDITARDGGPPEIWEPPWEGQEQWEQNPDRDMSGGSFFKRVGWAFSWGKAKQRSLTCLRFQQTITNPTRLSRLFAIHDPLNLVVLIYVRVGQDLCGHPSIIHGGFSAALMDELLGMLCWESFHVPLFTATLTIDYRKPVGLVDEWDGKKCKEMWGCAYITEKKGVFGLRPVDLIVTLACQLIESLLT